MNTKHFLKVNGVAITALLFAGATMSFEMAEHDRNADQTFFYVSEDLNAGAFHQIGNWSTVNSDDTPCTTEGLRPCKIVVPQGSTLNSVLGNKTNQQVLDISDGLKQMP